MYKEILALRKGQYGRITDEVTNPRAGGHW